MENLTMEMLQEIDGGKGVGRVIEAAAGTVALGACITIGVLASPAVGVAAGAAGIVSIIDACN